MFKLVREKLDELELIKLLNTESEEYFSIVPEFGANVNELTLRKDEKLFSIMDGNNCASSFKTRKVFNGAKLFPYPNRIENGTYNFEGCEYHLPINYPEEGNSVHGFVYNKFFELTDSQIKTDQIETTFFYNYKGDVEGYPFPFHLEMRYTLHQKDGFICTTKVKNNSNISLPFGDGWHPYLKIGSNKIDDLHLKFSSESIFVTNQNLMPIHEKKFSEFRELSQIGNRKYDDCFSLLTQGSLDSIELYDPNSDVKIVFWFESGKGKYNYVQLYTPPERSSIAIEPMTCGINVFNNKIGIQVLEPGEIYTAKYGIRLQ